jgi:hypothetical protein
MIMMVDTESEIEIVELIERLMRARKEGHQLVSIVEMPIGRELVTCLITKEVK